MGTMSTAEFAKQLDPIIRKVIMDTYDEVPMIINQVFKSGTSKKSQEEDVTLSGLDKFTRTDEEDLINLDVQYEGYSSVYKHAKFAKIIKISSELMEDQQHGQIKKGSQALGRAARATEEISGADLFNYAFTAPGAIPAASKFVTGGDGVSLCSTAHPTKTGYANRSNRPAVDSDLSVSSLKAALIQIRNLKDSRGLAMNLTPETLLIPPDLEFTALELLRSVQLSDTTDNNINSLRLAYNLKILVWDYLTDTDAWFILSTEREIHKFNRRSLKVDMSDDFDHDRMKWRGTMRYSLGHSDWPGIWGTEGA